MIVPVRQNPVFVLRAGYVEEPLGRQQRLFARIASAPSLSHSSSSLSSYAGRPYEPHAGCRHVQSRMNMAIFLSIGVCCLTLTGSCVRLMGSTFREYLCDVVHSVRIENVSVLRAEGSAPLSPVRA